MKKSSLRCTSPTRFLLMVSDDGLCTSTRVLVECGNSYHRYLIPLLLRADEAPHKAIEEEKQWKKRERERDGDREKERERETITEVIATRIE